MATFLAAAIVPLSVASVCLVARASTEAATTTAASSGGSGIVRAASVEVRDRELTAEQLAAIAEAEALAAQIAALEAELADAVAAIENSGYTVGYIAMSLDGTDTVEWNADEVYYGASSIKGPYCVSLVRALGANAVSSYGGTITSCLRYSSNESYYTLLSAYSSSTAWDEFVASAGLLGYEAAGSYAFYSARDLAKLWAEGAEWLLSDDENAVWLAAILGDTLYSTVDDIAGADGTQTCSKAGWYYGGGETYDTTADGGIVAYDGGTFVVAVMTSAPYDFDAVTSIMEPLVELWELTHAAASE